ncbi:MAG: NADH-quinone oxidoreductase subunit N [Sphingobacteriales bacterium]
MVNSYPQNIAELVQNNLESISYFWPEFILSISALVLIVLSLFSKTIAKHIIPISLISTIAALVVLFAFPLFNNVALFNEMVSLSPATNTLRKLILFATSLALVLAYFDKNLSSNVKKTEFGPLILFGSAAGMFLCSSSNLLMILISLETLSLISYILVAYNKTNSKSSESALKYVLFGLICTAFMILAMALIYGVTGTFNINDAQFVPSLSHLSSFSASVIMIFLFSGIGFKVALVPFHFWTPEVYQEAPSPVGYFLSTVGKIAGIAALITICSPFYALINEQLLFWPRFNWQYFLIVIAILTMFVGNLAALKQESTKRLLAYSSIAQGGFILLAVVCFNSSINAIGLFFGIYIVMNAITFLGAIILENNTNSDKIVSFKGLGRALPIVGISITIAFLSLAGFPPTAGFIAKLGVFTEVFELIDSNRNPILITAVIVAVVNAAIALFYYLKIPYFLFFFEEKNTITLSLSTKVVFAVLALLLLILGVVPSLSEFVLN